jgi:hypothetical protein
MWEPVPGPKIWGSAMFSRSNSLKEINMFQTFVFGIALLSVYFISGTYVFPVIAAIIAAVIFAAAALVKLLRRQMQRAKELWLTAGACILSGALIFSCGQLNNIHAMRGAVRLAKVCEAYKAKIGVYPETFKKLIPEYLEDIPVAKFTIMWAQYRLVDNKIMFVLEPGMLAQSYDLATEKWHCVLVGEMFPRERKPHSI